MAVLLYTPLICNNALLVPILAAYAGVVTRCIIIMVAYFFSVYPLLKKEKIVKFPNILRQLSHSIHVQVQVSIFKLVSFTLPLMLSLGFQRINRPIVNLLVAHLATSKQNATKVNHAHLKNINFQFRVVFIGYSSADSSHSSWSPALWMAQ